MDLSIPYLRFEELGIAAWRLLPSVLLGVLIFVLFLFIAKGTRNIVHRIMQYRNPLNLAMVLGRLSQWGVILIGMLVAVTVAFPSFTPANLISALGITGIAIGFAFRDIFENFLAGILILITEPFRVGDQIVYGEYEGTVENIETRATMLRTYDGRRIVIPNAELYKNSVTVNTAFEMRRMEYDFGIGYGDDIDLAKQIMADAMRKIKDVLQEPQPDFLTVDLSDCSVKIRARWWIQPPRRADVLEVTDKVISTIKMALTSNGIDLPFPTQHVLLHDQTEVTDGDRKRQREGWPAGKGDVPGPRAIANSISKSRD